MKVVTIGRETDNDVVIDDSHASRHHLQIILHDDGHYSLSDFGSSNGTFVNGQKIGGEITLNQYDIVRIGNTTIPWRMYFEQEQMEDKSDIGISSYTPPTSTTPLSSTSTTATLKVIRKKKLFGFAISFSVSVDGKKIGDLKNGVTLTCELDRCSHKLKIASLEKDISQEINISEGCSVVEAKVSLGMGILAGRPRIDDVKYM